MSEPKDLDGWRKNLAKFKQEWARSREQMRPHWQRFTEHPFDGHSYVNLWVEAMRISPYLWGHAAAVLALLLICVGISSFLV